MLHVRISIHVKSLTCRLLDPMNVHTRATDSTFRRDDEAVGLVENI